MFVLGLIFLFLNYTSASIVQVTDSTIQVLREAYENNENALVYLYSPSCKHCANFSKAFDILANESTTLLKNPFITFYRINIDRNPQLMVRFFIFSIPAVFHFHQGKVYKLPLEWKRDVVGYFEKSAWKQLPPLGRWKEPFGVVAGFLGCPAGILGFLLNELDMSPAAILSLVALLLFLAIGLLIYVVFYYHPGGGEGEEGEEPAAAKQVVKREPAAATKQVVKRSSRRRINKED